MFFRIKNNFIFFLIFYLILTSCVDNKIYDYNMDGFNDYYINDLEEKITKINNSLIDVKINLSDYQFDDNELELISTISQINTVYDYKNLNFDAETNEKINNILQKYNLYLVALTDDRLVLTNRYNCRLYYEDILDLNENVNFLLFNSFDIYNEVLNNYYN